MTTVSNSITLNQPDNVRHSARISIRKARKAEKEKAEAEAEAALNSNKILVSSLKSSAINHKNSSNKNKSMEKINNNQTADCNNCDENIKNIQEVNNILQQETIVNENFTNIPIKDYKDKNLAKNLNSNNDKKDVAVVTKENIITDEPNHTKIELECNDDLENEYFYRLMHLKNSLSYAPNIHIYSTNKYDEVSFKVLDYTCLHCSKLFENSQSLKHHFIFEHFMNKPSYKCDLCLNQDSYFDLDGYLSHLLNDHDICSNFISFYDLFLLKLTQDFMINYHIDSQSKSPIQKDGLISQLNSILKYNFSFSKSEKNSKKMFVWSNLIKDIPKVDKSFILKEIFTYFRVDESKINISSNNEEYMQCSYCLKLFNKLNDFKLHLFNSHAYSDRVNNYVSCSYCRQLIKVFGLKENMIDLLNKHILNEQCLSIKLNRMPIVDLNHNTCEKSSIKRKPNLYYLDKDDSLSKNIKLSDQSSSLNSVKMVNDIEKTETSNMSD